MLNSSHLFISKHFRKGNHPFIAGTTIYVICDFWLVQSIPIQQHTNCKRFVVIISFVKSFHLLESVLV